jgi:hypothetical protein
VVVSRSPPTHCGFRYAKGDRNHGPVLFYRKSVRGGRTFVAAVEVDDQANRKGK